MKAKEFIKEYSTNEAEEVNEQNPKKNARALVGSGRGGNTSSPNKDSAKHKKLYPPKTNYSKSRKKYNAGAKPGANDGFVG